MLRYGIPRYRLPRAVLEAEIQRILDVGVALRCNTQVGTDVGLEALRSEYQAVFVGVGAHKGRKLGIPGEDAPTVLSGTEFLNRVNRGAPVEVGAQVVVVGGGDTAIDAARVSRRLGAAVTVVYRRTREEMPAIGPEVEGALAEGVRIEFLVAPVAIERTDAQGTILRCVRTTLGEPDASGRRRPVVQPGTEFGLEASTVIAAVSQAPALEGFAEVPHEAGGLIADGWGATALEGVYAGGDDRELGLVTIAIAQGRFAAEAIDARFRGTALARPVLPPVIASDGLKLGWYKEAARHERAQVPVASRELETEVEQGLAEADAVEEAKRCMSCGMCMDCEVCWMYCTNGGFVKLPKGQHYTVKLELCNGCQKCAQECPCGYIEMA